MKRLSDPFLRERATPDRRGHDAEIERFLQNGGKVQRLMDSQRAEEIIKRRERRQKISDARGEQENPRGVIGGKPLVSLQDVLTIKE